MCRARRSCRSSACGCASRCWCAGWARSARRPRRGRRGGSWRTTRARCTNTTRCWRSRRGSCSGPGACRPVLVWQRYDEFVTIYRITGRSWTACRPSASRCRNSATSCDTPTTSSNACSRTRNVFSLRCWNCAGACPCCSRSWTTVRRSNRTSFDYHSRFRCNCNGSARRIQRCGGSTTMTSPSAHPVINTCPTLRRRCTVATAGAYSARRAWPTRCPAGPGAPPPACVQCAARCCSPTPRPTSARSPRTRPTSGRGVTDTRLSYRIIN
ncbi:unnamed protein product [Diatraea saccharalis]|uniref:Uncharacterized protein n=1 Tax=Diatraea saccharalis TaxID=40085 RepID=A0A9N9WAD5_9NEOP|nr:unnamed protein product [Diatraea saccharalis]